MTALPQSLPINVELLLEELDKLNPAPVVRGILTTDEQVQELVYQAGRRSIVEELIRLRDQ